jgi:hypothetical protein
MRRIASVLMLSGALMAPVLLHADDHHKNRYYDSQRKDYHEWNENEDRAYRHWVEAERHARYRDWKHASKADQRAYWQWRHAHEDWR